MAKQTFTTGQVLTAAQMTSLQQTAMGGGSATAKTASYVLVAADAGTTVIMNSASATTITVNTSLFSAGDTVFLQNIGAGVSTITAGTATVNTASSLALAQYESGNLYFTAAGASIFSKSDGAAASGSGFSLINTTSFSAVSSQSVNDVFSSTYLNYRIIYSIDSSAASENLYMRMRVSNSDNSSANYVWMKVGATPSLSASNSSSGTTADTNEFTIGAVSGTRTSQTGLDLYRPFATDNTGYLGQSYYFDSYSNAPVYFTGGSMSVTTSYTGFTFYPGSGTMTGSVRVYGYAN